MRKVQPDGVVRWSWNAYRIPDHEGFARVFMPARTPRRHAGGIWDQGGPSVAAIDHARPYVVHWWRTDGRTGFYVDTARSIDIAVDAITYVDLFLDLRLQDGVWQVLDEDELVMASAADAARARRSHAEVERLIASGDPLFDLAADIWRIPVDAETLPPRDAPPLE